MKAPEKDAPGATRRPTAWRRDRRRYWPTSRGSGPAVGTAIVPRKLARRYRGLLVSAGVFGMLLVLGAILAPGKRSAPDPRRAATAPGVEPCDRSGTFGEHASRRRDSRRREIRSRLRAEAAERQAQQERDKALAERRRADDEAATALAVSQFLQDDLLLQASPYIHGGSTTTPASEMKVLTLVDRASERISGQFNDRPLVEASIPTTLGDVYSNLGQFLKALNHFERAWSYAGKLWVNFTMIRFMLSRNLDLFSRPKNDRKKPSFSLRRRLRD